MENIEFLNNLGKIHSRLWFLKNKLAIKYQDKPLKLDVTINTVDRSNSPGSPIGINWEIDIGEQYFVFELSNGQEGWSIDGYVAKHTNLEVIENFIEIEGEELENIFSEIDQYLENFCTDCALWSKEK